MFGGILYAVPALAVALLLGVAVIQWRTRRIEARLEQRKAEELEEARAQIESAYRLRDFELASLRAENFALRGIQGKYRNVLRNVLKNRWDSDEWPDDETEH